MTDENEDSEQPMLSRRKFMNMGKGAGALGALSIGGTSGFYGLISALQGLKVITNPNYWNNDPIKGAHTPAIEHAAENSEIEVSIYHLDYEDTTSGIEAPPDMDADLYTSHVEDILSELDLEPVVNYTQLDPESTDIVPDRARDMHEFEHGGFEKGLYATMDSIDENMRSSENELIGVIGPFDQVFVGGEAPMQLDGVFQVDRVEGRGEQEYAAVTAHEVVHELGGGHTLADGMSNVPITQALGSDENYFGPETENWIDEIVEDYSE